MIFENRYTINDHLIDDLIFDTPVECTFNNYSHECSDESDESDNTVDNIENKMNESSISLRFRCARMTYLWNIDAKNTICICKKDVTMPTNDDLQHITTYSNYTLSQCGCAYHSTCIEKYYAQTETQTQNQTETQNETQNQTQTQIHPYLHSYSEQNLDNLICPSCGKTFEPITDKNKCDSGVYVIDY